jgi:hypothetical protein
MKMLPACQKRLLAAGLLCCGGGAEDVKPMEHRDRIAAADSLLRAAEAEGAPPETIRQAEGVKALFERARRRRERALLGSVP